MKAIWRNAVLAQSDATHIIEGNHYFPSDSMDRKYFTASATTTLCPWKGDAS
jgi:uncharacterized protein (DUF427 family)